MVGHERIMCRYDIQITFYILLYHAVCMELDTFILLSPLLCIVSNDSTHQFKGNTTREAYCDINTHGCTENFFEVKKGLRVNIGLYGMK